MARRNDLIFEIDVRKIIGAAQERLAYHEGRWKHWEGETERLLEKGVEIRPQMITGGKRFRVNVDSAIGAEYETAAEKKEKHAGKVEEYRRWIRAFEISDYEAAELDVDDIEYFGL